MSNPILLLEKAKNELDSGNVDNAKSLIQTIKDYQNNPKALYLLAVCHAIKTEYSDAERLFSECMNLTEPSDDLFGKIGLTQHHQQKIPEAIQSYQSAIRLNSNHFESLSNIAVCYDYENDNISAIKYAKKAFDINPNNSEIINIIAKDKLHNGDIKHAIELLSRSLSLNPQQPYIYVQLSNAYFLNKEYDKAEQILKNAINQFTHNPYLINSLGHFYSKRNRHEDAILYYERIIKVDDKNTVSISAKARSLISLEKFDLAHNILKDAHEKFDNDPTITTELCNYLILTKDYESAYALSSKFLSAYPSGSDIPVNIALSHSIACMHSERLDEARNILSRILNQNNIPEEDLETIYFSQGDILDKMKMYDDAFSSYKKANEVSPRPSDIKYYESILTDLAETVDRNYLDSLATSSNQSSLPVFIVGMPRSGTSLVEQILSSHPEVHGAGELTDLWKIGNTISKAMNMLEYTKNLSTISTEEILTFSNSYIEKLTGLISNESRVTDKLPHNFMHIGLIECLFPNANIIHCQRHPFDTCLSIYFRQFNDNNVYARKLEEIARFYKKYMELMTHWQTVSSLSILTVKYEDMVMDQEAQSRKMIEHIGLNWDEDVLRYHTSNRIILTPSYHQASRPIYSDSMYRWKKYSAHISPLIKVLGDPEEFI